MSNGRARLIRRSPQSDGPAATRRAGPTLIVTVLSFCGVIVSLQQTLLLPLLPELPKLLDASTDSASWLVTATLLSGAVATPTIARLADMYGKRRMMVASLTLAAIGSFVGAVGEALPVLIAARALQGVGMALIPVAIATMRDELPREKVPVGVALMSATLAIGAAVGLPMSGVITAHLGWHTIFWITGVAGVTLLGIVRFTLPESPVRTQGRFDLRGALLLSAALTAFLLAMSKGAQWHWNSPAILGLAAAGLLLLGVWVPLELRTPGPLVDLRVAGRRAVLLVNVASVLTGFAMFANMLVTTQLLQLPVTTGYGVGLDVVHAGLWMIPNAAAFGLMAPASVWLTRRFSPQVTLLCGALVLFVAYVGRIFLSDNLAQIVAGSVAVGIGIAMTFSAMPILVMRAVPVTESASANGLNVLLRAIGTSTASAATAAITTASVVRVAGSDLPSYQGLATIFGISAAASLAATVIAVLMLRIEDYAATSDLPRAARTGVGAQVVHGQVVDHSGSPMRKAVVTVLTTSGQPVDWGHADSEGRFTAAIPEPADYLVVATADGWQPSSRIMVLDGAVPLAPIVLRDRPILSGIVTDTGQRPLPNALVVLTRQSGEAVAVVRTHDDGRYEIPRPTNGRYVLTAVSRGEAEALGALPVTILDMERDINIVLEESLTEAGPTSTPRDTAPAG